MSDCCSSLQLPISHAFDELREDQCEQNWKDGGILRVDVSSCNLLCDLYRILTSLDIWKIAWFR